MAASAPPDEVRTARRPPLSPRTKLFQSQQFDLLKALDIMLLNISSERAREQLRAEFRACSDNLSKEQFVNVVLRILPSQLQFRSPLGMGDGMENAQLNVGFELTDAQRRDVAANLVDRVDTDGDGRIDWNEMSAFILFQSAVVAQSDFTVGRILPYRPLHEGGAVAGTGKVADPKAAKPAVGLITADASTTRLMDIMRRRQATLRSPADYASLTGALKQHQAGDLAKAVADLDRASRRQAAAAVGLSHSSKPVAGPGASLFNRSGIYGGVSLLQYVPQADVLAVVEPKVPGVRLLDPDDLSDVGVLDSSGRAIEAVASFVASTDGGVVHSYLAAASANATIAVFSIERRPFDAAPVNVWPTPDAQQTLLFTQRYSLLLSGSSSDGSLHAWNVRTGGLLASMHGHSDMCTGIVDLPDEDRVASCSHDKTVRVWDVNTCVCESTLSGHKRGVCAVDVYEERGLLLSGSYDHMARVWSPRVSKSVMVLEGHSAPLVGVACVPGTPEVISASIDGDVCVWDMRRPREPVHRFTVQERSTTMETGLEGITSQMTTFALCLRRRPKASQVANEKRKIGAAPPRPPGRKFKRKMPVRTPQGTATVVTAPSDAGLSDEGTPTIVAEPTPSAGDPLSGELPPLAAAASAAPAAHARTSSGSSDAAALARGGRLASAASVLAADAAPPLNKTPSGARSMRRAKSGLLRDDHGGGEAKLDHDALARPPRQVEVAERQVQQLVFGIKTLQSFTQRESPELLENSHREPIVAVAYSPLNHSVLSAAGTGVRVWSALVGVLTGHFEDVVGRGEVISSMLVDPRGVTFVVGTERGKVQQHNATSGHCIRRLSSHSGPVPSLAWYGRAVVSVGWDARVFLHSARETPGLRPDKHTEIGASFRHEGRVTCVAASDTLELIATGGTDNCVRVFKATTSQLERKLPHNAMVTSVLFVPELSIIISTDVSSTVFVWLIKSGVARYALAGGFRHRPVEWLDRSKKARGIAKLMVDKQRKRSEKQRFVLGLGRKGQPGKSGAGAGGSSSGGTGVPDAVDLSPRGAARAKRRKEVQIALERHRAATDKATGPADRPSRAERMLQGDSSALAEFRVDQELKRSGKRASTGRLRASILLGAGKSILSSPKMHRGSAPAFTEFSDELLELGKGNVDTGSNLASPMGALSPPAAALPTRRGAASPSRRAGAASSVPGVLPGKGLLKYSKEPHVLGMQFDQEDYLLYTANDEGWVTCWDLKAFLTAVEVQSLRGAKSAGVDERSVHRRLSVDISAGDLHGTKSLLDVAGSTRGLVSPGPADSSDGSSAGAARSPSASGVSPRSRRPGRGRSPKAAPAEAPPKPRQPKAPSGGRSLRMLKAASNLGAFDSVRQPVMPEGQAAPLVIAAGFLSVRWLAQVHTEAVTGLAVLRNPHMPETILSCGFDQCVRASDASDGASMGRLCQKLTRTGVNPHWQMVVDADSWGSKASIAADAAIQAADAEVKATMDVRSGEAPPRRVRSRTVAIVTGADWGSSSSSPHRAARDVVGTPDELELFTRAAAAVPLPQSLRFSKEKAKVGPSASSRSRVAMALRQAMEDADEDETPKAARGRSK